MTSLISKDFKMDFIDANVLEKAMGYQRYRSLIDELFAKNRTTGSIQSEAMLGYTKLNIARMRRLDKTTKITEQTTELLRDITHPIIWLTLTEGWCGDAAQIIPVLEHLRLLNKKIQLKLILRDEHLEIMDAFLTNGGRSIPKVIILDGENYQVLSSWGPRPAFPQQLIMDAKENSHKVRDQNLRKEILGTAKIELQKWYARDKTQTIQQEIIASTQQATSKVVRY